METLAKKQEKMGEREEHAVMGSLFGELVEEILDRIPIKPLTRMKCLSKGWCRLISHYRPSISRNSKSLFFLQYKTPLDQEKQVVFLMNREQEGQLECIEHNSLSFSINTDMECLGYSNGLLLWTKTSTRSFETVYICNSTINQWVSLPTVQIVGPVVAKTIVRGLAFDGIPDHHYNVVCFRLDNEDIYTTGYIDFSIFSSDCGSWRNHRARFRSACSLMLVKNYTSSTQTPYLFRKGNIHWVLDDYMLVYHIKKCFFELTKLPSEKKNPVKGQYPKLWESEGCLLYSYNQSFNKLHIFAYLHDNGLAYTEEEEFTSGKRQLKHTIKLATFIDQHPDIFDRIFQVFFEPFGFDEDLQIIYIQLSSQMIFCYSLETGKFTKAQEVGMFKEKNFELEFVPLRSFCMQSSEVNIPIGDGCKLLYPKRIPGIYDGRSFLLLEPCDS